MNIGFPTIVYRAPGTHFASAGTYDYRGVETPDQLEASIAEGWFLTLPEAIAGKSDEPDQDDNAAPTREELEAKATELGIKFDGRTTDKSLAEKIEFVLGEQE